ncbi:MaoC family dehydratase N-terminal domain-containing protein [Pusillimonas sp. MFBS29]|uniref:FAS1-like dehydratase domain-containing protein n=1 Tax=Pusillimonas sp. MFBS29 TaxID=2886690 RepID=UPI001D107813|nr:MaoC family dehydratase N-terminal domain-containing protein [Pusillimonas sp. MFBS29]MCC2597197.1 MaoC family dehydratase N-terminal domain-containing protein [Pusillimonas sp. MFBS29]
MSNEYDAWVGREEERAERIHASVAQAMAATLDTPAGLEEGDALPPGWQWLFFNPAVRRSGLGVDGHPKRGGFLPPIELPRRMWAGSRLQYLADIHVGDEAIRRSRIAKVVNKVGKRGSLWFVTVEHTTGVNGKPCIVEEQDIVYREATPPNATPAPTAERYDAQAEWGREVQPDTTLLFRYSALTFNGHRIHYDQNYARNEEGYPDLVVHGPLTATLLQQLALEQGAGKSLDCFEFRGVSPLFVSRSFRIEGRTQDDGSLALWARGPDGELAMSATATFR